MSNNINEENTNQDVVDMHNYDVASAAATVALKKAQIKNTAIILSIIAIVLGILAFQAWKKTSELEYIDGNILKISGSGLVSSGVPWKIESFISQLTWASVFETDASFTDVNPYLAEKYAVSPDGLTYTITFKEDLYWSDGTPFTLNDVVFSIESFLLSPGANTTISAAFSKITGVDEWVEVGENSWTNGGTHSLEGLSINGNDLIIELDFPYTAFPIALTQFIPLPEHFFKDYTIEELLTVASSGAPFDSLCSGMFMIDSIDDEGNLKLVHNPYYFREYSEIETVIAYADHQNMHIDYNTTSNTTEMVSYRAISGFEEFDVDVEWYRYFVFNLEAGFEQPKLIPRLDDEGNEILDENNEVVMIQDLTPIEYPEDREPNYPMLDVNVRKAISLAIDRQTILDDIYLKVGTIDFATTGNAEYSDFLTTYDLDLAREYLEASDYDLSRPLTIGYYHTDNATSVLLETVKASLEEIGFTVNITYTSGSVALYTSREYDFYLKAYPAYNILDWYNEYLTSNYYLSQIIGIDEFDDLMIALDSTTSVEEYREVFSTIQELDRNTMYKLPIVSLNDSVYINGNRVSVPDDMEFGNVRYRSDLRLDEWTIKKS